MHYSHFVEFGHVARESEYLGFYLMLADLGSSIVLLPYNLQEPELSLPMTLDQ